MPSSSSFPLLFPSPLNRRRLTYVEYLAKEPGAAPYSLDENTQLQPGHVPSPFRASSSFHPSNHRVNVGTTVPATCNLNNAHSHGPWIGDGSYIPIPGENEYEFTREDDIKYARQYGIELEPVVENHEPIAAVHEPLVEDHESEVENDDSDNETLDESDDDTEELEREFHRKHLALHSGGKTLNGQQPPAHYLVYPRATSETPPLEPSSSISGDDSDYESHESDDNSLTPLSSDSEDSAESTHANDQPLIARHTTSGPVASTSPTRIAPPTANAHIRTETTPASDLPAEEYESHQHEESFAEHDRSDDESKDPNYQTPKRSRKRRAPPKKSKITKSQKRVINASSSTAKSSEEPPDSDSTLTSDSTSESETEPKDLNMITPPARNAPLPLGNGMTNKSPARAANTSNPAGSQSKPDTGARTDKARAANASSPIGPQSGEARREGEKLATDLHQLQASPPPYHSHQPTDFQVRSPPLRPEQPTSIAQSTGNGIYAQSPPSLPLDIPRRQESTNSSSTEGSQGHPYPPSSLSDYTPEGYLKSMMPDADQERADPVTTVGAMSATDAADAAVMRLNGTSSVHTSSYAQQGIRNPFELPRGFDGFADPYHRNTTGMSRPPPMHPSRQTSTSTASASTSSEEEDICIPEVVRANAWEREPQPPVSRLPFDPYVPSALQHRSPVSNPRSNNAPRGSLPGNGNGYTAEPAALPLGATAHSPRGTTNSVPIGIANNESSEDDDDDGETVGDRSSRSRSTSSEIQEAPTVSKGKRKAAPATSASVSGKTLGKSPVVPKAGDNRPQKRRRSEVSDSQIDPSLKAEVADVTMESEDESPDKSDEEDAYNSEESEYDGPSRPRTKPRRAVAGRSKAAAPKATTAKKTKPSKAPSKPSSDGTTHCDYVRPYPVSLLPFSAILELISSHTIDVKRRLRVNTICPDTRIDMLPKNVMRSHKVNYRKTRLLSGLRSRTGLPSSVLNVTKRLPGKSLIFSQGVVPS